MKGLIEKALSLRKLMKEEVTYAAVKAVRRLKGNGLSGPLPQMQEIYKMIGQVAPSDVTVLLRGESGTGKELLARAIYQHSLRSKQAFLPCQLRCHPRYSPRK